MTTKQYQVYADPSHAWVKVDRSEIDKLGIQNSISPYSYQKNNSVFLEEDCDAPLFFKSLLTTGISPVYKEHFTNRQSKIRNYPSYTA